MSLQQRERARVFDKMARKKRTSAKQRALAEIPAGAVELFKTRTRTERIRKDSKERRAVGMSAQFVAASKWAVYFDSRSITRLVQIRLGYHFMNSLRGQVDPATGRRLPKPEPRDGEKQPRLGIRTGKMVENWQLGKITGNLGSSRGIVQPYSEGRTDRGEPRKFMLKYLLGEKVYTLTTKESLRGPDGKFAGVKITKSKGKPYRHAPVDFQNVAGIASKVIEQALTEYINRSGFNTSEILLPPPAFLGAGSLRQVRAASKL
jgi:hypothetical protein